ncbi:MAG: hypothetical protein K8823_1289 [Cenarchaeum symbiont of Oopsacas minuta]|nr:hypothetical protein [Cenarchaeum symbiont of Oopsacas minuta]
MNIGVATTQGRPYFRILQILKGSCIRFNSILPKDITSYDGITITTKSESPKHKNSIYYEEIFDKHPTIVLGYLARYLQQPYGDEHLVMGIDPGRRIGLAIFYRGVEIESSVYQSVDKLVSHLAIVLACLRARKKTIRIGCAHMGSAKRIADALNSKSSSTFEIEFIDEYKTTIRTKNQNQGGKRDKLSAKFISQRVGYRHELVTHL